MSDASTPSKYEQLKNHLRQLKRLVVSFSGGVDSTFLLKTAYDVLGNNVIAVSARSSTFPKRELDEATAFAQRYGIEHIIVDSEELDVEGFASNPPNRCYLCKTELLGKIRAVADARGIAHIAEGSNADDVGDYRPGLQAVQECKVLSPLRQAGLTKNEIRQLSKEQGLPTWNKQSFACLSSRFPYGETITRERLRRIDLAEQFLLDNGFRQVRVRFHGNLARIETDEDGFQQLADRELRSLIYAEFKTIGFDYVALDLLGYRTGSMNETLTIQISP
ncbi:MAG: ATP-dependent sacrificial sulfur transferase LarE [Planctomycetaceae bacterium]|nr:ATP-dependent sacrificial sulfur transferase LarE [Planctomycetaceae bacterium]